MMWPVAQFFASLIFLLILFHSILLIQIDIARPNLCISLLHSLFFKSNWCRCSAILQSFTIKSIISLWWQQCHIRCYCWLCKVLSSLLPPPSLLIDRNNKSFKKVIKIHLFFHDLKLAKSPSNIFFSYEHTHFLLTSRHYGHLLIWIILPWICIILKRVHIVIVVVEYPEIRTWTRIFRMKEKMNKKIYNTPNSVNSLPVHRFTLFCV